MFLILKFIKAIEYQEPF